jgi:hypothetical protein
LGLVAPLTQYFACHPNASIVNSSGVGGLRLALGFASAFDNFDGNVDMVTVGVRNQRSSSYDFEPPTCEDGNGQGDFQGQQKGNFSFESDGCTDGDRTASARVATQATF